MSIQILGYFLQLFRFDVIATAENSANSGSYSAGLGMHVRVRSWSVGKCVQVILIFISEQEL